MVWGLLPKVRKEGYKNKLVLPSKLKAMIGHKMGENCLLSENISLHGMKKKSSSLIKWVFSNAVDMF